ncbi:MAG: hypothetical protein QXI90_05580 [Thermofilum sp.]
METPRIYCAGFLLCVVSTLAAGAVAFYLGLPLAEHAHPLALPLLQVAAVYPAYLYLVRKSVLWRAAVLVLLWAAVESLLMVNATYSGTLRAAQAVINGEAYREEMFAWIRTGAGPEGDPALFVIPKLREIALFSAATFASAGFLGLLMGSILLNYMNYYVGCLLLAAKPGALLQVALLSWQVYAVLRVVGYVLLGVALTRISLLLWERKRVVVEPEAARFLVWAAVLIAADFALKATVANAFYQPLLSQLVRV